MPELEQTLTKLISNAAGDGFYERHYKVLYATPEELAREDEHARRKSEAANLVKEAAQKAFPYLEFGVDWRYRVYHYVNDYYVVFTLNLVGWFLSIMDRHYKLIGRTGIPLKAAFENEVISEAAFVKAITNMEKSQV